MSVDDAEDTGYDGADNDALNPDNDSPEGISPKTGLTGMQRRLIRDDSFSFKEVEIN